jgi:hypothetical protein
VDTNTLEEQLERIVGNGQQVGGVAIWPDGPGRGLYMGCLLDNKFRQIPGSTVWNWETTVKDVMDSLERAADNYKERNSHD